jgi:hypothetical protein
MIDILYSGGRVPARGGVWGLQASNLSDVHVGRS